MGIGGGKSSGSSAPVVTQEQKDLLKAQTGFLTDTALPAYQKTLGMANTAYGNTLGNATNAAQNASNVASQTGAVQQGVGTLGALGGMAGLASLFNPQYEQGQVNAALQAGRESARESQAGQNAMYGGAGGLGGARMALADKNLASLNAQRQATAAAAAQAGVQGNKAAAAGQMLQAGQTGLNAANTAAASQIGYAGTPQDVLSKYASVIYGTPQGSTTPNFGGTQGSQTTGKGAGFKFGGGS